MGASGQHTVHFGTDLFIQTGEGTTDRSKLRGSIIGNGVFRKDTAMDLIVEGTDRGETFEIGRERVTRTLI